MHPDEHIDRGRCVKYRGRIPYGLVKESILPEVCPLATKSSWWTDTEFGQLSFPARRKMNSFPSQADGHAIARIRQNAETRRQRQVIVGEGVTSPDRAMPLRPLTAVGARRAGRVERTSTFSRAVLRSAYLRSSPFGAGNARVYSRQTCRRRCLLVVSCRAVGAGRFRSGASQPRLFRPDSRTPGLLCSALGD